ncbi:hypothetical protein RBH26_07815 [Natronolimnohabitans sp. A-GB9]|nr:hypothetical protein [Natronolimnohabitans sp. A-GB9]MDQ2050391.1 hypothetical protein [Natronolimnohabitans sp. A-GB9]
MMAKMFDRVRQRTCSHDYELLWREVDGEMKTFECKRCGRLREE